MKPKGGPRPGAGRPRGKPNSVTSAVRKRIESEADPVGFLTKIMHGEAIEAAPLEAPGVEAAKVIPTLSQRMAAARILADKLVPNAKPTMRRIVLEIQPIQTASDALPAHDAILSALGAGEVSPDEAAVLAEVVNAKVRAIEVTALEARIAALEAAQGRR